MGFSEQRWEFLKDVYFDQFMIQWTWIILLKWKQGSGSYNLFCRGQFLLNLVGFWLPFSLNQQFVIVFVHKMSKIKVKSFTKIINFIFHF